MGIIIIAIIITLLSIGCYIRHHLDYDDELKIILSLLGCISGFATLIICIIVIINTKINDTNFCIQYQNDKQYIESNYSNENLTDNERMNLNNLIILNNNLITECRIWKNNFWIGWFYPHRVGDLELFDIKKIKSAKLKVDIEKKN